MINPIPYPVKFPPADVPAGKCAHDGTPSMNASTMIRTTIKGEKWVICTNCRIGWNKEQYLIDNPKGIFDNGEFTDPMTIEQWRKTDE